MSSEELTYPRVVYNDGTIRIVQRNPKQYEDYYDIEHIAMDAMRQPTYHHIDCINGVSARKEAHGKAWRDALIVNLLDKVKS